jgi:hypothetical protein
MSDHDLPSFLRCAAGSCASARTGTPPAASGEGHRGTKQSVTTSSASPSSSPAAGRAGLYSWNLPDKRRRWTGQSRSRSRSGWQACQVSWRGKPCPSRAEPGRAGHRADSGAGGVPRPDGREPSGRGAATRSAGPHPKAGSPRSNAPRRSASANTTRPCRSSLYLSSRVSTCYYQWMLM